MDESYGSCMLTNEHLLLVVITFSDINSISN